MILDSPKLRWLKTPWGIVLIFILLILFMIVLSFGLLVNKYVKEEKESINIKNARGPFYNIDITGNYFLGTSNPKLTIVEFGDFSCPKCKLAFSSARELGLKHGKDVKIIWKDYPVVTDQSVALAMAGRCAGELGFFWQMYDRLFLYQGITTDTQIAELARQVGLDMDRFSICTSTMKYLDGIRKDAQLAQTLEVQGTPTWIINGYKTEGYLPIESFEEIINNLSK